MIKRREAEAEGLPPGRSRLTSPYDTSARWGVKRDTFWNGYKVHVTETCDTGAARDDDTAASSRRGRNHPPGRGRHRHARARYRGLDKTRLEHTYAAVALNLIRLDAWWNGHPLDRTRTSHLAAFELQLAS